MKARQPPYDVMSRAPFTASASTRKPFAVVPSPRRMLPIDRGAGMALTNLPNEAADNAWAYRWSLRQTCAAHRIRQVFIRPHCPWQNGKVERLNRTLLTEWAYRQVFTDNDQRAAALAP